MEKGESSYTVGGNVNQYNHYGEQYGGSLNIYIYIYTIRDIVQETGNQDHPHGKEMQKSKMAVWGGLTNSSEKEK